MKYLKPLMHGQAISLDRPSSADLEELRILLSGRRIPPLRDEDDSVEDCINAGGEMKDYTGLANTYEKHPRSFDELPLTPEEQPFLSVERANREGFLF